MILAFLHLEDEPKLTKFTYGFSKYLSDITSTILFSQFSDDLNTSTIREVINAKNVKSFKNNKFFVNNIESTKTLETELSLNKVNLLKKLVQTFAFLVYESDLEKTS